MDPYLFSVYPWPLASGKNGQQVVDTLQKNVELAGALWSNGWCVDCETYQSAASMGMLCLFCHRQFCYTKQFSGSYKEIK